MEGADGELILNFSVLKTQIRDDLLRERLMATLASFFGALATVLTLAGGSAAAAMLYGLKTREPLTLGAAIAGMAVVALVASILPAQRAATVHPMEVLREE
jgi:ABC-type lipoprotein release transport system permease subunit